ncbi:SRPBCC family protein [Phytohabitans sp. ZYX-F-186]|uniref:SRPBCC family protein n=1 Tax=Phytohabitans maris TaxID=3071409 RepID=A0ABU0ZRI1_9ACTN|nr:SRPBCC family protein [Phytohabitans sp. ZYX-F-186]MDQ7909644.1 SRPBCC family protein [Phytohabitans sp. ZYX-F-186]
MRVRDIDVTVRSEADADAVYRLLVDGATWPAWSGLGSFELERADPAGGEGVGAVRIFRTWPFTNHEEIVEAVPGRRFSYRLLSGMALNDYRADVDLTPDGDGTLIRWHSTFTAKRPWMGGFYRWFLGGFIKGCARGLARAAAGEVRPGRR